jgi:hypothetical protein
MHPLVRIGSTSAIRAVIDNLSVLQAEIEELVKWTSSSGQNPGGSAVGTPWTR